MVRFVLVRIDTAAVAVYTSAVCPFVDATDFVYVLRIIDNKLCASQYTGRACISIRFF